LVSLQRAILNQQRPWAGFLIGMKKVQRAMLSRAPCGRGGQAGAAAHHPAPAGQERASAQELGAGGGCGELAAAPTSANDGLQLRVSWSPFLFSNDCPCVVY